MSGGRDAGAIGLRGEGVKDQSRRREEGDISSPDTISARSTDSASFGQVCLVLQLCQMELSGWLKKKPPLTYLHVVLHLICILFT